MDDIKTDGYKPAPTWFWISLALIVIASIIAYVIFQHDRERNQFQMEKKIAVSENRGTESIFKI